MMSFHGMVHTELFPGLQLRTGPSPAIHGAWQAYGSLRKSCAYTHVAPVMHVLVRLMAHMCADDLFRYMSLCFEVEI